MRTLPDRGRGQRDLSSYERTHLTHSNVIYDRTAGLPMGRETYGNGDLIVVVGVTTHSSGWQ